MYVFDFLCPGTPYAIIYYTGTQRSSNLSVYLFFFLYIDIYFSLLTSPGTYLQAGRDQKDYGNS